MRAQLLFKGRCTATVLIADTTHECGELAGHAGSHRCTFNFPGASPRRCRFLWADEDNDQVAIADRVDAVHV